MTMRLLLDENLPKKLKYRFSSEFSVLTVSDLGWQAKQNGELLAAMLEEKIQVLITADKNLRFQQNLEKIGICVVILMPIEELLLAKSTFSYHELSL
jgi:predicted nuclease of predicted toxin-antitoxin system